MGSTSVGLNMISRAILAPQHSASLNFHSTSTFYHLSFSLVYNVLLMSGFLPFLLLVYPLFFCVKVDQLSKWKDTVSSAKEAGGAVNPMLC